MGWQWRGTLGSEEELRHGGLFLFLPAGLRDLRSSGSSSLEEVLLNGGGGGRGRHLTPTDGPPVMISGSSTRERRLPFFDFFELFRQIFSGSRGIVLGDAWDVASTAEASS